ncbi:hypothetical protein [Bacillus sp. AG4(2022)]|uniref:hypothetical protein n=1 Tax=Bacillus sp. AG4(2022) TaxID=2962594 RepID=UPI0028817CBA|nr:hypothetical protein [Bacillus sp. AG4(2022)]MDT0162671.1 hypothetical protein [Bacillus sp. AG4(2022)]
MSGMEKEQSCIPGECGIHEWIKKGVVMYPGRSAGYMIGMEKEQSCIPGGVRDT